MSQNIPLPRITELTKRFWDACEQGVLLAPRCHDCGKFFFRPELACTHCFSTSWEWIETAGRGKLYSYTVIERPPTPGFKTPLIMAIVDVDEGFSMFSNLVGIGTDEIDIGMSLFVRFQSICGQTLPFFTKPGE
jgi:uncharacterized protein